MDFNLTLTTSPGPYTDEYMCRGDPPLPLSFLVHETELNDPQGDYQSGSEWMQSATGISLDSLSCATLHHQPQSIALTGGDSSPFIPQATSSLNTSRPFHRFSPRRIDAAGASEWTTLDAGRLAVYGDFDDYKGGYSDLIMSVVSGGRTVSAEGSVEFKSDWVLQHAPRCFQPTDPSYLGVLGPVLYRPLPNWGGRIFSTHWKAFPAGISLKMSCGLG